MRILHVCDSYLPQLGGIELHVDDLAARQRGSGDEVRVATLTPSGDETEVDVVRLPRIGPFPRLGANARLNRLVADYDVVHAHVSLVSPLAWAAVKQASRLGVATMLTMHSMLPRGASAQALRPLLWRVPGSTVLSAVSTVAADALGRAVPNREVHILPNGIEPRDWHWLGDRAHSTPLTLVSTMRTTRRKRPLPLLRILREVRRTVPDQIAIRAVLVGAGPQDRAVRRELRRTGLGSWVVQAGQLERAEILRVLSAAHLYLAPAKLESFGIAALEARCAGLPVIGMARSGLSDFIDDGTAGYLVDTDEQMAALTARLLTHPDQLETIRSHNLQHPPSTDWAGVLELHRRLYARAGETVAATASARVAMVTQPEAARFRPHEQADGAVADRDAATARRRGRQHVNGGAETTRKLPLTPVGSRAALHAELAIAVLTRAAWPGGR
jgi:glycosyltransferase involved in cell wall biosynthesis